jgi:hypothetical protein
LLKTTDVEVGLAVNAALHVYLFSRLLAQLTADRYPFGLTLISIELALLGGRGVGRGLLFIVRVLDLDDFFFLFGAGD